MPFDGITMNVVKKELENLLVNSRVDKIYQPHKETIILKFRTHSSNPRLLLSCKADSAGIHLVDKQPENPKQPPVFCMVLRKYLENGKLISIEQQGLERILTFKFQSVNEAGSLKHLALYCEIMGKHSNIVLVDTETGCILDGAKRFTHEVNRYREVFPGIPYVLPPSQNKSNFLTMTEEQFYSLMLSQPLDRKLPEILLTILEGFSPLLCQETIIRAGLPQDMVLNRCGQYELAKLWQVLSQMVGDMAAGRFVPTLIKEEGDAAYREYFPFDMELYRYQGKEHFNTMNEALDTFFQAKENKIRFNEIKHRLERTVNSHIKKARNKMEIHEQELAEAYNGEKHRIAGEIITANIHAISRGDKQLNAVNYYDPEQKNISIELNPSLSPSQNAQRYFKKYRKAAVKKQKAMNYIAKAREDLLYMDTVNTSLSHANSIAELQEIEEELVQQKYIKRKKGKTPAPKKPGYLTYKSSDGFTVMVGKNNRQNDFLTMKVAKDEDMWFHTKEIPGAHVIIKTEGKEIPESTLLEAAMLASYYSKGKLSGNVPVDYTLRANVRKPKGAKPGLVIYEHYSTIYVTPEKEKVESLVKLQ